ncbi:hypothetical protein FIBSPDRAFT_752547 [Athelia psychrophila]|uniref:Uncharacterized protein n=1 Tax=Athelia psychrophila TaxID=1759441 RepID=A0A166CTJ4_9AGAM|nr:hypothetical protein FIBSPDRAFT_797097 [Fibularhizoctonia sp. CBS 109695]KZP13993.1 hypothetical protein FIBSPDRAFT_752547 [Fibularhizoctonia sp. CBS 109695]
MLSNAPARKTPPRASYASTPVPPANAPPDPLRVSAIHLLSRAHNLPCSSAAQAFSQLVQPTSRFQLALDALLPLLSTANTELAQRILVSFIMYSLYAPHPIAINPFKTVLFSTFVQEKETAVRTSGGDEGKLSENEQLVWVLWKILKGDGNDLAPYSPNALAKSPLPPKLRPSNLLLDEQTYTSEYNTPYADTLPTSSKLSHAATADERKVNPEEDAQNELVARAMALLLAARERVLSLSEQRILVPALPDLIAPPMITSLDLTPLIAHNPTLAHPLLIALLAPRAPTKSKSQPSSSPEDPAALNIPAYLDVLRHMPPTLPSFDLLGRLLRDPTPGTTTVADLVRGDVLGRFIHEAVNWLDNAEREAKEGLVHDDRFAKGVQNLCRFYTALLKMGILDAAEDADTTEMRHFVLRHSHFEEAGTLFRVLGAGAY